MTEDEARTVITILLYAHQRCGQCAEELVQEFQRRFPAYAALAQALYDEEFGDV